MMADGGNSNGKEHGGAVGGLKCPTLHVVFDPRTCAIEISGEAPSLVFSRHMLLMAIEKLENSIRAAQQPLIETAGGPIPFHRGG
jgi:hypothetical protein